MHSDSIATRKKPRHPLANTVRGDGHPAFVDPRQRRRQLANLAAAIVIALGAAGAVLAAVVSGGGL